jgi:hypothetical protein
VAFNFGEGKFKYATDREFGISACIRSKLRDSMIKLREAPMASTFSLDSHFDNKWRSFRSRLAT